VGTQRTHGREQSPPPCYEHVTLTKGDGRKGERRGRLIVALMLMRAIWSLTFVAVCSTIELNCTV
jgi:hypothetical protein